MRTSSPLTQDETILALLASLGLAAGVGSLAWGLILLAFHHEVTSYLTLLPWLAFAFGLIEALAVREHVHARTRDPEGTPLRPEAEPRPSEPHEET